MSVRNIGKPQVAFLFAVLLFMFIFLSRKSSAVVVLDCEQYHEQLLGISYYFMLVDAIFDFEKRNTGEGKKMGPLGWVWREKMWAVIGGDETFLLFSRFGYTLWRAVLPPSQIQ